MKKGNEQPVRSIAFQRKRKFLLVLPILVIPFLWMLVWTLGFVGEVKAASENDERALSGLNMNLPAATPGKDSAWNKMRYYEQAEKDSVKLRALLKNDPYRKMELQELGGSMLPISPDSQERSVFNPSRGTTQADENEARVYRKLAALNKELEQAAANDKSDEPRTPGSRRKEREQVDTLPVKPVIGAPEVDRLERMMQSMNQPKDEDPELTQLNQLLEKILEIQHPDRVQEKLREESKEHKRQVYAVEQPSTMQPSLLTPSPDYAQLLQTSMADSVPAAMQQLLTANRFYSLSEMGEDVPPSNTIAAVVHEDQTLVTGGTVRLRLLQEVLIAGVQVPRDHFVFATASLNGERLFLTIQSVSVRQHVLPVSLVVYDPKDGMAGIRIPGAITRDVAKRSAAQSARQMNTMSALDPSLGAQMATAGIQAAQQLVTKSAKLVQVTLTAGYPVLLKDENVEEK